MDRAREGGHLHNPRSKRVKLNEVQLVPNQEGGDFHATSVNSIVAGLLCRDAMEISERSAERMRKMFPVREGTSDRAGQALYNFEQLLKKSVACRTEFVAALALRLPGSIADISVREVAVDSESQQTASNHLDCVHVYFLESPAFDGFVASGMPMITEFLSDAFADVDRACIYFESILSNSEIAPTLGSMLDVNAQKLWSTFDKSADGTLKDSQPSTSQRKHTALAVFEELVAALQDAKVDFEVFFHHLQPGTQGSSHRSLGSHSLPRFPEPAPGAAAAAAGSASSASSAAGALGLQVLQACQQYIRPLSAPSTYGPMRDKNCALPAHAEHEIISAFRAEALRRSAQEGGAGEPVELLQPGKLAEYVTGFFSDGSLSLPLPLVDQFRIWNSLPMQHRSVVTNEGSRNTFYRKPRAFALSCRSSLTEKDKSRFFLVRKGLRTLAAMNASSERCVNDISRSILVQIEATIPPLSAAPTPVLQPPLAAAQPSAPFAAASVHSVAAPLSSPASMQTDDSRDHGHGHDNEAPNVDSRVAAPAVGNPPPSAAVDSGDPAPAAPDAPAVANAPPSAAVASADLGPASPLHRDDCAHDHNSAAEDFDFDYSDRFEDLPETDIQFSFASVGTCQNAQVYFFHRFDC